MNIENIKTNFEKGFWNAAMVGKAVEKGAITKEQYKEIVGKDIGSTQDDVMPLLADASTVQKGSCYLMNNPGTTYHRWDCTDAKSGKKMTLAEIAKKYPESQPCGKCNPPDFVEEEEGAAVAKAVNS